MTSTIQVLFIVLILLSLYFLPTIVAVNRSHNNHPAIFITNLLVGWTVLGWIVALIWSFTDNVRTTQNRVMTIGRNL